MATYSREPDRVVHYDDVQNSREGGRDYSSLRPEVERNGHCVQGRVGSR